MQGVARDSARQADSDARDLAAEALATARRLDGSKARRNHSGVDFDPVTLSLRDTEGARAFAAHEAATKARSVRRSAMLDLRSRSSPYDIINGR